MQVSNVKSQQGADIKSTEKNKKKSRNVVSSIVASDLGCGVGVATIPLTNGVVKAIKKIGELPQDKIDILHKTAEKAIKDTGLADKGTKILYLSRGAGEKKANLITKMLNPIEAVKDGENACLILKDAINPLTKIVYKENTILMPEKNISFSSFHEIGHALNRNFSKFGKILQNMKNPIMQSVGLIVLFGAFTRNSKPEEGKDLTKGQKIKNFIRNNAGKLSFAAMIPILVEEGMATYKGQKLADKMLSKDMAKIVSKGNKTAYLSYVITAAGIGLSSYAAVKIKDYLVAKKENKAQNANNN